MLPSAGNATENGQNPIGIYRHPQLKVQLGCIDPVQADAAIQAGYVLVKECQTIQDVLDADAKPATAPAPAAVPQTEAK